MRLTIGFSPCPNDTFIFDALVNKKIDTEGFEFDVLLEDVETLNQWAMEGKLDITKLSFPAYFENEDEYALLNSGSALGKGVGPLLISKTATVPDVNSSTIALPGQHTTANLLFSFAYPDARNKKFMTFNKIESAVLKEETKLGVIIHENRFTYKDKGLHKVTDLGEYWESKMQVPIPLGCITIKKSLGEDLKNKIDQLIHKSISHAFSNYPTLPDYVKIHSQEMSEDIMRKHIELYVNDFTLDLGQQGMKAIKVLQEVFEKSSNKTYN